MQVRFGFENFVLLLILVSLVTGATASDNGEYCNVENEELYSFNYAINSRDVITQHSEERAGDRVRGIYSFLQPDKLIRIVQYQVDEATGFQVYVEYRKFRDVLRGHLSYPRDFQHPIIFATPVHLITKELLYGPKNYPNLPT